MRLHLYTPRGWFTVRGAAEEFDCRHCAAPVLASERAYLEQGKTPHECGEVFCSARCRDARAAFLARRRLVPAVL